MIAYEAGGSTHELTVALVVAEPELREAVRRSIGDAIKEASLPWLLADAIGDSPVATATELGAAVARMQPDVVVLGMPGLPVEPSAALRQLRAGGDAPRVVVVNDAADPELILSAMRAGASEFVYPPFNGQFAEALHRIAAERRPQEPGRRAGAIYGFLSVKGGCGATTVACHAAAYLSRRAPNKALLADLDSCGSGAAPLVPASSQYNISDALDQLGRLDATLWKALAVSTSGGFDFVAAPQEPVDLSGRTRELAALLRFWRSTYAYTILDLGHGLTPGLAGMQHTVDSIVLVSTDEAPALRQAKRTIAYLTKRDAGPSRLRLLLNRLPRRPALPVAELERILDFPVFATIPNDYRAVTTAHAKARLLEAESAVGASLATMAAKLAGLPEERKRRRRFGLFGR
jgi:pilus assembly protein CpaE